MFYHHGVGCVVHDDAVIGESCKIFANVTIGNKWSKGKNLSGPPHIGNNVMIAPNSFVNFDVPDNSVVIGNPGVIHHSDHAVDAYIGFRYGERNA